MSKRPKIHDCPTRCPVEATLDLIGGKWKGVVLHHLLAGPVRFGELGRRIETAPQRVLARQLRELEDSGLVVRTVYPQMPPRVEYSLSRQGRSLEPVLRLMHDWGRRHLGPDGRLLGETDTPEVPT